MSPRIVPDEAPETAATDVRYNLLTDPLLGISHAGGRERVDLPTLFARLVAGNSLEFTGLAAHQQHGWHAFLVQLAGLVVSRSADPVDLDASPDAGAWRAGLLSLTRGRREPWCLLVENLTAPAFLQPPVPDGDLANYPKSKTSPEELDILVMAKNHDVKALRFLAPEPDHWIYALVNLQTMSRYDGAGNYGIARMFGGYGSRPCVTVAPSLSVAHRFIRDLQVLLAGRTDQLRGDWGFRNDGQFLLWLSPWTGAKQDSLDISDLDPFFIEIARRYRLTHAGGAIVARYALSKSRRVRSEAYKGNLSDPWVPIRRKDSAALNLGKGGANYKLLHRILPGNGGEYRPSRASKVLISDGETPVILVQGLAGGEGETRGYHERVVPVPTQVIQQSWSSSSFWDEVSEMARRRVAAAEVARSKVLHPAVCLLLQGAPEKLNFNDEGSHRFTSRLDREIDRLFFTHLWADLDLDDSARNVAWDKTLWRLCREIFDEAVSSVPIPDARFYRSFAIADRALVGSARKNLRGAFSDLEPTGGATT